MFLKKFKPKTKEESIFKKIIKTPDHIQDILLEKYFIPCSELPSKNLPIINNLKDMYDKLMTIKEIFFCCYLNPFSDKYITIELNPIIKENCNSSYMQADIESVEKQLYFESLKVCIMKANVIDGNFGDRYSNFKHILYHELAHAHFGNILTALSRTQEVNADISSIIYSIKHDNLSLDSAKKLIDYVLKMRIKSAHLFCYTRGIYNTTRVHRTEDALILFRCLDESILKSLKNIPTTDIVRYVIIWLQSVSELLLNPYSIDFKNKHLLSFLFYNNYNPVLMIGNKDIMWYIRSPQLKNYNQRVELFKRRFYLSPLTEEEMDIMKEFYLLNVLLHQEYFNDFMTSHMLVNNFDYIVNNLFNQFDYKYVFLDSLLSYEKYKYNIASTIVDIPFGYNNEELNNFINNIHCKI